MTNARPVVIGLGEILWDLLPQGPQFGGAPANYACHAAQLGAEAAVVSAVGRDSLGDSAITRLQERGVETRTVSRSGRPTGTVDVTLDAAGHASYRFAADTAWDHLAWSAELEDLAGRADAVCFGTLGQRSLPSEQLIRAFVDATPPKTLRIFDINLRPPYFTEETILRSLVLANVLKLNEDELPVLAELCGLSGTAAEMMESLADRYGLRLVALTRGAAGSLLLRGDDVSERPGQPTDIRDTVGAGDAFTASLTVDLLAGLELDAINRRASEVAAFVCTQSGATPRLSETLRRSRNL